jgi:hypothetical protein
MYDKGKVVPGLIIFLALVLSPIVYNAMSGGASVAPEVKYPPGETQCIESKQYMRENHMQLLIDWRETVVREGNRIYTATDGKEYNMSLTSECMSCHSNKAEFCDRCHDYLKVKPYCWDCHIVPPPVEKEST